MTRFLRPASFLLSLILIPIGPLVASASDPALVTVAEQSNFQATARYDDVQRLCEALDRASDNIRLTSLGQTVEGRSIPVLLASRPAVDSPEAARASGKVVCLVIGSIHGGEVCGKEALPMLMREIAEQPDHPLLDDLILAFAPVYNADGAERFGTDTRPGQVGPHDGTGERHNAQDLDLNRDFMKLDAPETRALVQFLDRWNVHLFIDTHTTNGSSHRYVITYDGIKNPATNPALLQFTHETLLPQVDAAFEEATGAHAYYYGNFNRDRTEWSSYPAEPRYGTTYVGLRNRLGILSEAYAYAPYKDRVLMTREFVRHALQTAAHHRETILKLCADADRQAAELAPNGQVPVRSEARPAPQQVTILGAEEPADGSHATLDAPPRDFTVTLLTHYVGTHSVPRPTAYVVPASETELIARLQAHGIQLETLSDPLEASLSVDGIQSVKRASRPYQGRTLQNLETSSSATTRRLEPGTVLVPTAQPLGTLAAYLLEPSSDDNLATWGLLARAVEPGDEYPVARLLQPIARSTVRTISRAVNAQEPDAPQEETEKKLLTLDVLTGSDRPNLSGSVSRLTWFDDDHFLERGRNGPSKVHVESGESTPLYDSEKLVDALARIPTIDRPTAERLTRTGLNFDPSHSGVLINHGNDLYYAKVNGSLAVRLTSTPGQEELTTFSPDGRFVAFVRDNDLYVVDLDTQTERALTTGGTNELRHGKAVWVYFEELFNRDWKAYWWSPDSTRIAFLELDDRPLNDHIVLDDTGPRRVVEETPYPFAGEPNPLVRLGIASINGAPPIFADLANDVEATFLISDVGWFSPDSLYAYVQNRTQTWLDLVRINPSNGSTKRLFRDQTKAWIDNPGSPHLLADGRFLWLSERDGYKHIYLYSEDGSSCEQLTQGPWEIQRIHHVDDKASKVYFSAMKDSPIAPNLYRLDLGDRCIERLTPDDGSHSVNLSPDGSRFLDSWSNASTPSRLDLRKADGSLIRRIETAEVPDLEKYRLGSRELLEIEARDGTPLQAELILPADLDTSKMYPVWFQTYAGPHTPTISDSWAGARARDHALANEGFIVFRMDPRSASGRGAASAWTAYRKLGVQELEDITDAIEWLKKKPYVDPDRIGMTGHSYGGYMTSYAMTHSKLFACGIAGAPVTDWRNYDTIYTERFMGTPQDNPEGYAVSSVVEAAENLHGRLLLVHGVKDDNVSLRNSLQLIHALQRANKTFELMIYPDARHGIPSPHYNQLQLEFIQRTLGGGPKPRSDVQAERAE